MSKKRCILLAALLVTILGGLVLVVTHPHDPEPVYQGKPLSAWLEIYWLETYNSAMNPTQPLQLTEARTAIGHIGSNAIPTLLRKLRATDSPFILKLVALAQKQHVITIHYTRPSSHHAQAFLALHLLGPHAEGAVPELLKFYDQNPSLLFQQQISMVFGAIGPNAKAAIPSLLRKAADANDSVRFSAVYALGAIHAEPDLVVPALVSAMRDPSAGVRQEATHALGAFGAKAKVAVPALLELRKNSYDHMGFDTERPGVESALRRIDPEAAAKAGIK